jgi:hypothetical protein
MVKGTVKKGVLEARDKAHTLAAGIGKLTKDDIGFVDLEALKTIDPVKLIKMKQAAVKQAVVSKVAHTKASAATAVQSVKEAAVEAAKEQYKLAFPKFSLSKKELKAEYRKIAEMRERLPYDSNAALKACLEDTGTTGNLSYWIQMEIEERGNGREPFIGKTQKLKQAEHARLKTLERLESERARKEMLQKEKKARLPSNQSKERQLSEEGLVEPTLQTNDCSETVFELQLRQEQESKGRAEALADEPNPSPWRKRREGMERQRILELAKRREGEEEGSEPVTETATEDGGVQDDDDLFASDLRVVAAETKLRLNRPDFWDGATISKVIQIKEVTDPKFGSQLGKTGVDGELEGSQIEPAKTCGWRKSGGKRANGSKIRFVCSNPVLQPSSGVALTTCGWHVSKCWMNHPMSGAEPIAHKHCNPDGVCLQHFQGRHMNDPPGMSIPDWREVPGVEEEGEVEKLVTVEAHPLAPKAPHPSMQLSDSDSDEVGDADDDSGSYSDDSDYSDDEVDSDSAEAREAKEYWDFKNFMLTEPPRHGVVDKASWWLATHSIVAPGGKQRGVNHAQQSITDQKHKGKGAGPASSDAAVTYKNRNYDPAFLSRVYRVGRWSNKCVKSATKIQAQWRGLMSRNGSG